MTEKELLLGLAPVTRCDRAALDAYLQDCDRRIRQLMTSLAVDYWVLRRTQAASEGTL